MSNAMAGVITCDSGPNSIRATVFRETLKRAANSTCVNPIRLRIALNSFGVMYHYVAMNDYVVNDKSPALMPLFRPGLGVALSNRAAAEGRLQKNKQRRLMCWHRWLYFLVHCFSSL